MNRSRFVWGVLLSLSILALAMVFTACVNRYEVPAGESSRRRVLLRQSRGLLLDSTAPPDHTAPPGSLPSLDEEVWVIVRPKDTITRDRKDNDPGSGALITTLPGEEMHVPVPLRHTDVSASIKGFIASVDVTQRFQNPYGTKIEASYVFPLPQNAAVNGFVMTIGDRRIRGIIRQRQEAEQIYAEAKQQVHVASLLTQERPNIFTQKVANIEPGRQIDVHIRYFQTLAYVDGWYQFVFPMVVGPRFNPPGQLDGVGAVARGRRAAFGHTTQVSYLRPDERSGHDIALAVDIDAGVSIEEIQCGSHRVDVTEHSSQLAHVALDPSDRIPNKDFVLKWRVAGDQIKTNMFVRRSSAHDDAYFALMLYPPAQLARLERYPLELVFVIDCSGSMRGRPLKQAKAAIDRALRSLDADDTFQLIRFSNDASEFGPRPVHATSANVRRARSYVRGLSSQGGTMMIEGIKAALDFDHDPRRLRFVVFLTDGYVGNDRDVLAEVHRRRGESRIFSFGVGSSPNRYLMNRMAKLGRGAVAYLPLSEDAGAVMDAFFERIAHPAMANIEVDWGDLDVAELHPRHVPDLFVGRPVVLTGRLRGWRGDGRTTVRLFGSAGDSEVEVGMRVDASGTGAGASQAALAAVWARQRIADLYDRAAWDNWRDLEPAITDIALRHNLMSPYTAFLAVDASRRTSGSYGTTVPVPVPVPDGVLYETTVAD